MKLQSRIHSAVSPFSGTLNPSRMGLSSSSKSPRFFVESTVASRYGTH